MATVGQLLTAPENGWKRFDDTDNNITFTGSGWLIGNDVSAYLGKDKYTNIINSGVKFNFTGDKIRYIGYANSSYSKDVSIIIDGNEEHIDFSITSGGYQILQYEKLNLDYKEHTFELRNNTNNYVLVDAIDIDSTGELKSYNPNPVIYKYLIQDGNKLYTYPLSQIGTTPLTDDLFKTYGIDNITTICLGESDLDLLNNPQIVIWCNNQDVSNLNINIQGLYNKNLMNTLSDNTQILFYTDDSISNPTKLNKNVTLSKPYIATLSEPEVLCYSDDLSYTPKIIVNGNEKTPYKYKVENIEGGNILKDYGDEITQDAIDNIVIPFSTMETAPNNPFHIKVTAMSTETGSTITNTGTVMFYDQAPTCVVQPIDGKIVHMLMGDPDNDKIRYQIIFNDEKVYPSDSEWSPLIDAGNVNYTLDINKIRRNALNTFRLKVQDEFGVQQSDITVDFTGSYYGLMFYSDEVLPDGGHYYSDDLQRVLNKIFMGTIVAGQKSPVKKIYVKNMLGYDIQNVNVALTSASTLPTGSDVLLGLQEDSINSHSISIPNILHNGESVEFYIQVITDILEETGGEFTITVNSESVS